MRSPWFIAYDYGAAQVEGLTPAAVKVQPSVDGHAAEFEAVTSYVVGAT